jgi:hypothetical protein
MSSIRLSGIPIGILPTAPDPSVVDAVERRRKSAYAAQLEQQAREQRENKQKEKGQ